MSKKFLTPVVLPGDPSENLHAATKQYVDDNIGGTWGSITGTLNDQTDLWNELDNRAKLDAVNRFWTTQIIDVYEANDWSTGLTVRKQGTTGNAAGAVASGAEVGYHTFSSWDGSTFGRNAYAIVQTTQAQSSGNHGASYSIATAANGTSDAVVNFTVDHNGNVGIGTDTPSEKLQIVGNVVASGTVSVAAPTADSHAATKKYVDDTSSGASALDDLTDVSLSSPSTGQVLSYNGSTWANASVSTSNAITGQSGGTNGRVVRYSSSNTWANASQADTIDQLTCVLFLQGSAYYPTGSLITGLSGLTAGTVYYLSTAGNITSTAPTPSSTVRLLVIGKAISTTTLLFQPGIPIGGE